MAFRLLGTSASYEAEVISDYGITEFLIPIGIIAIIIAFLNIVDGIDEIIRIYLIHVRCIEGI
jgi:hypothetical protein